MQRKKKTEEDVFEFTKDELDSFEDFFIRNWKRILSMAIVVATLCIIFIVISRINTSQNQMASKKLSSAPTIEGIEEALTAYPNHPAAEYAKLRLASMLIEKDNLQEASEVFHALGNSARFPEVIATAKLNEAYLLELMDKKSEAVELFKQITSDPGINLEVKAEAYYASARLLWELGDAEQAKTRLKYLDSLNTYWRDFAKQLERQIDASNNVESPAVTVNNNHSPEEAPPGK